MQTVVEVEAEDVEEERFIQNFIMYWLKGSTTGIKPNSFKKSHLTFRVSLQVVATLATSSLIDMATVTEDDASKIVCKTKIHTNIFR